LLLVAVGGLVVQVLLCLVVVVVEVIKQTQLLYL
jgi:hypothetical protein